jgi:hypothetical protein
MSCEGQSYNQPLSTLTALAPSHWQKIQFNISEADSHQYTREKVASNSVILNYMPTEQMIAYGFTEALPPT